MQAQGQLHSLIEVDRNQRSEMRSTCTTWTSDPLTTTSFRTFGTRSQSPAENSRALFNFLPRGKWPKAIAQEVVIKRGFDHVCHTRPALPRILPSSPHRNAEATSALGPQQ